MRQLRDARFVSGSAYLREVDCETCAETAHQRFDFIALANE